jgi:archaellum component FlaC
MAGVVSQASKQDTGAKSAAPPVPANNPIAGETLKVASSAQGVTPDKIVMEPIPGTGDRPNEVYAATVVGGDLPQTARYGNLHSYTEDLQSLVKELDDSQEESRNLRVKLVEKDNFLSALMKRERVLKIDLDFRKSQLAAMNAHIQSMQARIERLKKERQQAELDYERHAMLSASRHISNTISSVDSVSDALNSRIQRIDARIKDEIMRETEAMRRSLQPDVAAGDATDEGALQAVAASAANVPSVSLLQEESAGRTALRGV